MSRIQTKFFYICISVIFFSFFVKAIVGNLSYNLTNTSTDDGLIAHALAYSNPDTFSGDFRALNFRTEVYASIMNLIPSLSMKFLNIHPINFYVIFLVLQIVLLPLAVYRLSRVLGSKKQISIAISLAVLIVRPHYWNLSWTGDLDWMPYATWLALPFFIFYIAEKIKQSLWRSYFALLLGFLIHPSMGCLVLIFDVALLFLSKSNSELNYRQVEKKPLTYSYLACILFLFGNYVYSSIMSGTFVPNYYKTAILGNTHFNAVITSPSSPTWRTTVTFWLLFVMLTFCVIYLFKKKLISKDEVIFLKILYFVLLILVLLQVVAIKLQQITIMRLLPSRFSIVFIVFIFVFVLAKIFSRKELKVEEVILILLFLSFPGIMMICIISTYYFINISPKISRTKLYLFFVGVGLFILTTEYILRPLGFARQILKSVRATDGILNSLILPLRSASPYGNLLTDRFELKQLVWLILATLMLALFSRRYIHANKGMGQKVVMTLLVTVLSVGLINGRYLETAIRHPSITQDLYLAQTWAKINTPTNSLFMGRDWSIYLGWRNLSERGMVSVYDCGSSPYFWSKSDDRCNALQKLALTWSGTEQELILKESNLTGATYLLRKKTQASLSLPIEYENGSYVIYDLGSTRNTNESQP
jgi:hypothetical protein